MEYMYLVVTHTPDEDSRRRLTALLLCLFDVLRALIQRIALYDVLRALIQRIALYDVLRALIQRIALYIQCQTLMADLQRRCSTSVQ